MRLLFLSMTLPWPPNNGHRMRTWSLLRALAAEGHSITLLAFAYPADLAADTGPLRQLCTDLEVVPLELASLAGRIGALARLRALIGSAPYAAGRYRSPEMAGRIQSQLQGGRFDAVIVDTVFGAVNLPSTDLPLLLNNVDVEHVILERYVRCEGNPAKRLYAWLEARRLRRFEAAACRRAAVGMPCSPADEAQLRALCPGLPLVVVPNVVDTAEYAPPRHDVGDVVLYQGGLDWYPNRDAVRFFAWRILPLIRRARPSVRFVVAGRNPPAAFRREVHAVPGLELTGPVPDMRPVLARSSVCVVPLRIGSGTRIKILEAAAMARPVVSTTLGAEGLEFVDGEEILVADGPERFAQAVLGLLADHRRRREVGSAARKRVEESYSPPVLRSQLRRVLGQVRESRPREEPAAAAFAGQAAR
jgi:glycosyltransferase involved in cell wall biosynthesis